MPEFLFTPQPKQLALSLHSAISPIRLPTHCTISGVLHGVGHPSPLARLFAVQAPAELCQMDRAWARLRELIESHPNWPDAHRTAAELFISRGCQTSLPALQQAQLLEPDHPELIRLEALLRQQNLVGTEPSDNDALRTLMDKAKRLLRTGSK